MTAIAFVGASAALGGSGLAWLMARSIDRPLRRLEHALADLRGGRFDTRVRVTATDEIGAVEAGFNQMAHRLQESYRAIETRNRELAEVLGRVTFSKASSAAWTGSCRTPCGASSGDPGAAAGGRNQGPDGALPRYRGVHASPRPCRHVG
jgi:HAMP domain-containing protein